MSSSSSSSSSSEDGDPGRGGQWRRRGGDYEGPSSSRRRAVNDVWPEPFLEALAIQVASDSRSNGRLAAAPSIANIFQVCTTWRAVSRSDPLWARLTSLVWGQTQLNHATWHEEYVFHHRTWRNFRLDRSVYSTRHLDTLTGLVCRCLALSDLYLACGFVDGTVSLFDLATLNFIGTCQPHHQGGLGLHPRAVAGIIITDSRLVFATLAGDIHVAMIIGGQLHPAQQAQLGDVVNDGALVDFAGCGRWWVGLYAGVPGRAFHIWDGTTEELVYIGHSLTDPESVMGWRMLTELAQPVARVRVSGMELAVACTSSRAMIIDLRSGERVFGPRRYRREIIVTSVDSNNEAYMTVDIEGNAVVRRVENSEVICRFGVGLDPRGRVMGCMNLGYALMYAEGYAGGPIAVNEVETAHGHFLYRFGEGIGEASAIVANNRYVAVYTEDATIHLWDFGAH